MTRIDLDKNLFRAALGWNYEAWGSCLRKANFLFERDYESILEIGASQHSITALVFDGLSPVITIGYYSENDRGLIIAYFRSVTRDLTLKSDYHFKKIDIFDESNEEYDLVICKSVLGGVFRAGDRDLTFVNSEIRRIVNRFVTEKGYFVSLDNGKSCFDYIWNKVGARKNNWRLFKINDLTFSHSKFSFGVLSAFSLETRLGKFGTFIDNRIFYPIDVVLYKFIRKFPTIIVSIFVNEK